VLTQLPNQGLFLKESSNPPASSALSSCEHVMVRTSVNAQLNSQLKIATLDLFSGSNHKIYLLTSFISHSVALHISFFRIALHASCNVDPLESFIHTIRSACQFISHNNAHITDN